MQKANADFKVNYEYADETLKCTLVIAFRPYDCTEWKNEYTECREGSGEEQLQWLQSTLYNYIPFALIRNTREGIYNDIQTGEWEEIDDGDYWEMKIESDWSLGEYGDDISNLFTKDLKSLAMQNITQDEKWYETPIGRVFAFSNAVNGNILFSANTQNTGFSNLLKSVLEEGTEGELHKKYEVWKRDGNSNEITITLTKSIHVANDHKNHTYAIVAANPSDYTIFTKYIYIENEPVVFDNTKFEYATDSLSTKGCKNKINVTAQQGSDRSVIVKLKMGNMQWIKLHPQIKFRVKLKRLLS